MASAPLLASKPEPPADASALPRGSGADFSLQQLWRVLLIRRRAVLFTLLAMVSLAIAVPLLMTPKYEAASLIEVNKENSDRLGLDELEGPGSGAADSFDYNLNQRTQADVLQSQSLALQAAEQLGLEARKEFRVKAGWFDVAQVNAEYRLPLDQAPLRRAQIQKVFERNLTVKPVPGTRMIEVRFLSPDPQVAADVVNTLVSDYLEQYFKIRYSATAQASEWLAKQLDELKSQVEQSQQRLNQLQKQAGILGTDETHNVVMAKLEELNKQLTAAEANRILKQAVSQIAKSGSAELISSLATSNLIGGPGGMNPNSLALVQSLRSQETELRMQYAQAGSKYGPNYPKLVQMRSQLKEMDAAIHAETDKLAARAENDYVAARSAETMLRASFDDQKSKANQLNDSAIQYTILKREVESSRQLYDDLLKKLKEGGILAGLRSSNVVVIDPARTTAKPALPNYPLNLGLGFGLGLLGGIALAFLREGFDDTIRTPEQIGTISALTPVAIIPELAVAGSRRFLSGIPTILPSRAFSGEKQCNVLESPLLAEAFRGLRTSLLMSNGYQPPKVLLVTSALPQEGKSTTSLNVAITLAQLRAKVLLIDADLRRPTLHRRLELGSSTDLAQLLASDEALKPDLIQYPCVPSLSILPCGTLPDHPAELLASPGMRLLIAESRRHFDYIVIDSPAVLSVTDAVILSAHADAVLLVARSGQTTQQALLRAREVLARAHANLLGVLVNCVDLNSPDHYYYYGYHFSRVCGICKLFIP